MYANYSGCRTVSNQRGRDYNVRSRSHVAKRCGEWGGAADGGGERWAVFEDGKRRWRKR